jgi:CheY-like chemotaxis protein
VARVLVVDEEPDIRTLVTAALERDGHDVLAVATRVRALRALDAPMPDNLVPEVVVLDDWALLHDLKRRPADAGGAIPVVLFTTRSDDVDRAKGAIEGAVVHVAKPATDDDLRVAVTRALKEPEPVLRRKAQERALATLARLERNDAGGRASAPRPRLSGLERRPVRSRAARPAPPVPSDVAANLDQLTDKQRTLLATLQHTPTVMEAASELQMSRSNVYASLRRIGRTLGTRSVPELLAVVRRGELSA